MTEANWTQFETVTCSRCAGSGHYSSTREWGTTCFKCGYRPRVPGRGRVRSARGQVAYDFLGTLLSRPMEDVRVGDLVFYRHLNGTGRFHRVEKIEETTQRFKKGDDPWQEVPYLSLSLSGNVRMASPKGESDKVRLGCSKEHKLAAIALALRYQDCLTKRGTERKAKKVQAEIEAIKAEGEALWLQHRAEAA